MLKLYGRRSAFNVQKVAWLIAELGLEHEHIELGGAFGGLDYRKRNPHGRVPAVCAALIVGCSTAAAWPAQY